MTLPTLKNHLLIWKHSSRPHRSSLEICLSRDRLILKSKLRSHSKETKKESRDVRRMRRLVEWSRSNVIVVATLRWMK